MPTILVVDDDATIVDMLRMFLKERGYNVVTASDGFAVTAQIQQHKPDLIILDYMMPAASGAEVMRRIRGLSFTAWTPVIILSAAPLYEIKMNISEGPNLTFLPKPVDFPTLKATIEGFLGTSAAAAPAPAPAAPAPAAPAPAPAATAPPDPAPTPVPPQPAPEQPPRPAPFAPAPREPDPPPPAPAPSQGLSAAPIEKPIDVYAPPTPSPDPKKPRGQA
ncbi:MAG: response regulator [Elusimicrobia bacterium]|nr:response regulator [Elusimicrobiota bacterium]